MNLKRFKQLWSTILSFPSKPAETIGGMKRSTARKIIQAEKDEELLTLKNIKKSTNNNKTYAHESAPQTHDSAWISVLDAMPDYEKGDFVLVVTKWGEMAVACLDWEQGHQPDFWHVVHDKRYDMQDVTHWMPLPPAPKH